MRVLIVDDEELARMVLREMLAAHPDLELIGEAANGYEAVKAISELRPDLVLLDIQMPKLNGFEVLELAAGRAPAPHYIFVSAFDQYALKAFEVHALDYLLKPVSPERLAHALNHARQSLGRAQALAPLVQHAQLQHGPLTRILIRDGGKVHVAPLEQIRYIEAQDDYVQIHCAGRSFLKNQRLSELEALLDPARFLRIHRSYILNLDYLARIEPLSKDSQQALLTSGDKLPISRSGYQKLKDVLQ
ncbi:LytTR family DNA-binding domain-containing protein [Massilia sp. W12]|uniref:LytR/AlgR family response regulator transcription factor n=1 Tax=Massilia sp. W12 TaxID=3126507 RepID=UPI0030D5DB29